MHVEAIGLEDGRLKLLLYPATDILPYTSMTVEQYLETIKDKQKKLQLNIYHYARY